MNQDELPDLICWLDFANANFVPGDNEGVLTGSTNAGDAFEGKGVLKIVTGMPDVDRDDREHHRR